MAPWLWANPRLGSPAKRSHICLLFLIHSPHTSEEACEGCGWVLAAAGCSAVNPVFVSFGGLLGHSEITGLLNSTVVFGVASVVRCCRELLPGSGLSGTGRGWLPLATASFRPTFRRPSRILE